MYDSILCVQGYVLYSVSYNKSYQAAFAVQKKFHHLETVRSIVSDMLVKSFVDGRHCSIG